MFTYQSALHAVQEEARGVAVTRENYHSIVDRIYPEGKTYRDIYALARTLTFCQKETLAELTLEIPENQVERDPAKTQTKDWSDIAALLVLTRQAWDAEYPVVKSYVDRLSQKWCADCEAWVTPIYASIVDVHDTPLCPRCGRGRIHDSPAAAKRAEKAGADVERVRSYVERVRHWNGFQNGTWDYD